MYQMLFRVFLNIFNRNFKWHVKNTYRHNLEYGAAFSSRVVLWIGKKLPIILSKDGDIEFLRSVAKRKISSDSCNLDIYNVMDLIMMIAQKEDTAFSKKRIGKSGVGGQGESKII